MQKHLRENGNVIYGDLNRHINLKINFTGKNNILFLSKKSCLKNTNINFFGSNSLVFIGDSVMTADSIDVQHHNVCFIGNNNYFNPAAGRWFAVTEHKNIILGNNSLFSHSLWFRVSDPHLLYDRNSNIRINPSQSIYLGDHIWVGQEVGFLKGSFIASGSVIGAKSLVTSKRFMSNTINAGNPCRQVKERIFWSGEYVGGWDKETTIRYEQLQKNDFKYTYEKDSFLSPKAIEAKLESLQSAQEKLEFVYDTLYCNMSKNRFAYFEDCPFEIPLPPMPKQFEKLRFETSKDSKKSIATEISPRDLQARVASLELALFGTAVSRVQNHLSFKLGQIFIKDSKTFGGILKLPFKILIIYHQHNKKQKQYQEKIEKNPYLKLPPLESCADYKEALKIQNHFSYKLGRAFVTANSVRGGGANYLPISNLSKKRVG